MKSNYVFELVEQIGSMKDIVSVDGTLEFLLRCQVKAPVAWNPRVFTATKGITLPDELTTLWNHCAGLHLFEDVRYGQWGLILWSSAQTLEHQNELINMRSQEYIKGDLIIGEFLGDSDLILIRCDLKQDDFGSVLIVHPIDIRKEWITVADSLSEFLSKYILNRGGKFWE